jgi:hypothetical protein
LDAGDGREFKEFLPIIKVQLKTKSTEHEQKNIKELSDRTHPNSEKELIIFPSALLLQCEYYLPGCYLIFPPVKEFFCCEYAEWSY